MTASATFKAPCALREWSVATSLLSAVYGLDALGGEDLRQWSREFVERFFELGLYAWVRSTRRHPL